MKYYLLITILICGIIYAEKDEYQNSDYFSSGIYHSEFIVLKDIVAAQIENAKNKVNNSKNSEYNSTEPEIITIQPSESDLFLIEILKKASVNLHQEALLSAGISSLFFLLIYFLLWNKVQKKDSFKENLALLRKEKLIVPHTGFDIRKKNFIKRLNKKTYAGHTLNNKIKKMNFTHGEALLALRINELNQQQIST